MVRDIENIKRDLENIRNDDIIYKKRKIKEMFLADPDLQEVLGVKSPKPLNKYVDPKNPTEEELKTREEILFYNKQIQHDQIVDYIKLNGIQKEVLNFVMFDIDDNNTSYNNEIIKNQYLIVVCLVHENDMQTEYDIVRTDLLSYIVKDLLCWTNALGLQIKCINDFHDIIDAKYYARTLKFNIETPNVVPGHMGMNNRHDRFH